MDPLAAANELRQGKRGGEGARPAGRFLSQPPPPRPLRNPFRLGTAGRRFWAARFSFREKRNIWTGCLKKKDIEGTKQHTKKNTYTNTRACTHINKHRDKSWRYPSRDQSFPDLFPQRPPPFGGEGANCFFFFFHGFLPLPPAPPPGEGLGVAPQPTVGLRAGLRRHGTGQRIFKPRQDGLGGVSGCRFVVLLCVRFLERRFRGLCRKHARAHTHTVTQTRR